MAAQTTAPVGAQWFALHTLSGQEGKVRTYIEKFKKAEELAQQLGDESVGAVGHGCLRYSLCFFVNIQLYTGARAIEAPHGALAGAAAARHRPAPIEPTGSFTMLFRRALVALALLAPSLAFAQQEGAAFVAGDGVNKPKGYLAYDTVANSAWVYGKLGFIATGAAGAFPATNPAEKLIDLVYSVKPGYRANGSFVMNRATLAQALAPHRADNSA